MLKINNNYYLDCIISVSRSGKHGQSNLFYSEVCYVSLPSRFITFVHKDK
jgi:hypothetical protein